MKYKNKNQRKAVMAAMRLRKGFSSIGSTILTGVKSTKAYHNFEEHQKENKQIQAADKLIRKKALAAALQEREKVAIREAVNKEKNKFRDIEKTHKETLRKRKKLIMSAERFIKRQFR